MERDFSRQSLTAWLAAFERIYYQSQNHDRDVRQVLLHLYETVLNFHKAVLKRKSYEESLTTWLPKIVAWYSAVVKQLGVQDLETSIWKKFPEACPFCLSRICNCKPDEAKKIDQIALANIAISKNGPVELSLKQWQDLFEKVYQQSSRGLVPIAPGKSRISDDQGAMLSSIVKLYEELIELAEAIRLRAFYPENVRNELCDVFACICGIANIIPKAFGKTDLIDLGALVWNRFPLTCDTCKERVCRCRPRLVRERLSAEGVREFEQKDELTGLFNRAQFQTDLNNAFRLTSAHVVGQMYFDCDNFKAFNDQTEGGHRQGDAVLKAVSKALMEVSSPKVTSYRFGGDEFTVIIIADTEEEAKVRAKQVFASINGITVPDIVSNAPLTVKISAGFAIRTDELGVPDELTAKADSLLYEAKKAGKGQIVVG